jgi:kynurenine formamidase
VNDCGGDVREECFLETDLRQTLGDDPGGDVRSPELIELNHIIEDGMDSYPGLPSPRISAILTHEESRPNYEDKAEFLLGRYEMPANLGTYLDSPFHRYRDREDLSRLPLSAVAGLPGLTLDGIISEDRSLTIECDGEEVRGRAVLIRTGWDERWGTSRYWEPGPFISDDATLRLLDLAPALVGVDFWNVDDTTDPCRPVHTRLLERGILIVENLCNLGALPRTDYRFFAVPLRIRKGASIAVRAFAEIG